MTGEGTRPARARSVALAAAILGCAVAAAPPALAQSEPKPPRAIAPDLFPPTSAGTAAPAETRADIVAPTEEHPTGACRRGARDWLACLSATATLSDRALDEVETKLADAVGRRPQVNVVMRKLFVKELTEVETDWRALRERECQGLPAFEKASPGPLYELRLTCRIRRNLERIAALQARYGDGE